MMVLSKAGVRKKLLKTVTAKKLAYGHTVRKQGSCLEKKIMQGTIFRCTQARKTTHSLDGQHQDVDRTHHGRVNKNGSKQRKWRKCVHGVANPRIEDAEEQNRFGSQAPPRST